MIGCGLVFPLQMSFDIGILDMPPQLTIISPGLPPGYQGVGKCSPVMMVLSALIDKLDHRSVFGGLISNWTMGVWVVV